MFKIKIITDRKYPDWYIGVTDHLEERRARHGDPVIWHVWEPSNEETSREIEKIFLDLGMDGGPGGSGSAKYVYIYKK